jgi:hypothetical protein
LVTILGEDGQLTHTIKGFGHLLEETVLRLREPDGIANVVLGSMIRLI